MVTMTVWDFVIGVLSFVVRITFSLNVPRSHGVYLGFFFVVQNSQLRSIRAMYTGGLWMSALPSLQRAHTREVAKETTILRLQGMSQSSVFLLLVCQSNSIRLPLFQDDHVCRGDHPKSPRGPSWERHPIQFLVLDFSPVAGVDMSSAEAFVPIQWLVVSRQTRQLGRGAVQHTQQGFFSSMVTRFFPNLLP